MKPKEWTIKDVTLLKKNFYNKSEVELMELFPSRTWCAIYNKALTLGMREKYKQYR